MYKCTNAKGKKHQHNNEMTHYKHAMPSQQMVHLFGLCISAISTLILLIYQTNSGCSRQSVFKQMNQVN